MSNWLLREQEARNLQVQRDIQQGRNPEKAGRNPGAANEHSPFSLHFIIVVPLFSCFLCSPCRISDCVNKRLEICEFSEIFDKVAILKKQVAIRGRPMNFRLFLFISSLLCLFSLVFCVPHVELVTA